MKKTFLGPWLICLAVNLGFLYLMYAHMPDRFAVHFGADGRPNGWATKESFFPLFGGLVIGVNIIIFFVAQFAEKLPPSAINLPNKEYWFATPERLAQAHEIVKKILGAVGVFVNLVFFACCYAISQASGVMSLPFEIPMNGVLLIIGLGAAILLIASYNWSRPPSS